MIVCGLDELADGTARRFDVDGRAVAVVRIGDAVYAIYAGVCVGLIVMFVVSLPSDLALRREHRRLANRERDTAVRRSADAGGAET